MKMNSIRERTLAKYVGGQGRVSQIFIQNFFATHRSRELVSFFKKRLHGFLHQL